MLRILQPVDEVTADDLRYVRIWKIWANYDSRGLLLAEDFLVALGSADVFTMIRLYEFCAAEGERGRENGRCLERSEIRRETKRTK